MLVAAGCPAAEASPVVHAARRAGGKVIGLVEGPDAGWAREAGLFDDEVARGLGHEHADKPTLETQHHRAPPATAPRPSPRRCRPSDARTATMS